MNTTKFRKNTISGFGVVLFVAASAISALANHPVLVEGNCNVPPAGSSSVITPGTCGDYDGDGKMGRRKTPTAIRFSARLAAQTARRV